MFQIRYDSGQGERILTLKPAPTDVDYPVKRLFNQRSTQDRAVIIQRPIKDDRVRKWIWKGYRPYYTQYEAQWQELEQLEVTARLTAGLPTHVWIREDETGIGGFDDWVRVEIVHAYRTLRSGGGIVTYDESVIEFVIVDENYTHF